MRSGFVTLAQRSVARCTTRSSVGAIGGGTTGVAVSTVLAAALAPWSHALIVSAHVTASVAVRAAASVMTCGCFMLWLGGAVVIGGVRDRLQRASAIRLEPSRVPVGDAAIDRSDGPPCRNR